MAVIVTDPGVATPPEAGDGIRAELAGGRQSTVDSRVAPDHPRHRSTMP